MSVTMIRVTVWNENMVDSYEDVHALYPEGLHAYIAGFLRENEEFTVRTATMDEPENGLPDSVLENTDVLVWWAHIGHHLVDDGVAWRVQQRVLRGMGLIVLHSGHMAKPFQMLMGTSCTLCWRDGDFERLWTVMPNHPIAKGVDASVELEVEEMYGERFDVPQPDELVFLGWFSGGEVFRSGCCWYRGLGRVFYFQPGHESNPTYHQKPIQTILKNAVAWAAPNRILPQIDCPQAWPSPEAIRAKTHSAKENAENK